MEKQNYNLLYLAKPIYGGWVTFTSHLSHKYESPIYKITNRTEKNKRDYGYGCKYQNIDTNKLKLLGNIIVTAIDKHYYEYLYLLPVNTTIIIHDPTECKTSEKNPNPLVQKTINNDIPLLKKFNVITIRESVQKYLLERYDIHSKFMYHPFHPYKILNEKGLGYKCVSIARIDFDKNTDILLKANQKINKKEDHIYLFGAENRIYVHHKLKQLNINQYWKGKFPKFISPTYNDCSILKDAKYMIDMSTIKDDGGGTQYTFLEAIHENVLLILNNEWINKGNTFKSGYNCIGVSNENELSEFINNDISIDKYNEIIKNSKKILENHI
tara:strand:+ start:1728 stop:2708 length:981 start_codon:yes stop_codon:yes gene_type:complete